MPGIAERTIAAGHDFKVAVTCSPRRGIDATLDLSERLSLAGLEVCPHVSARLVADQAHARRIVTRLDDLGIKDVFVIGGDVKDPAGPFDSAGTLLSWLADAGHHFEQIGVAGYPEGHPTITAAALWRELRLKQTWATYAVTQLCFDAGAIARWLRRARSEGISLSVHIGLSGAVDRKKLLRVALRIGVGDSTRFLAKNRRLVSLLGRRRYTPDRLIDELQAETTTRPGGIAGYHIYTFNDVTTTQAWRRGVLEGGQRGR